MRLLTVLVCVVAATPVIACDREMLTVEDWAARETARGFTDFVELDVAYRFNGDMSVRMIDGRITFYDVLDEIIGSITIERDQNLAPGAIGEERQLVSTRASRLVVMSREDVVTTTCVQGVVYEDGTVERFD